MPTIKYARQQQREIEKYWRAGGQDFGALIGWLDWETEIRIMKWGWKRINANRWEFDSTWAVEKHWATGRWFVQRDGRDLLEDYATDHEAIQRAEREMECNQNQK